jgi:hypothetical protein
VTVNVYLHIDFLTPHTMARPTTPIETQFKPYKYSFRLRYKGFLDTVILDGLERCLKVKTA